MKLNGFTRRILQTAALLGAVTLVCVARIPAALAQGETEEVEIIAVLGDYDTVAHSEPQLFKAVFEDAEGQVIEEEKVYIRWIKINDKRSRWGCVSAICPHLKCKVNWEPERDRFVCPCYGCEYDINGTVVKGPSKNDLPDYSDQVFTEDGKVKLRRFVQPEE
jgi:Rieske Fe-S protein